MSKAEPRVLNDKWLIANREKLKAPPGEVIEIRDLGQSNLILRVSDGGRFRWYFYGRLPTSLSPVRRALGEYDPDRGEGHMSLAQARQRVLEWQALRKAGVDPKVKAKELVAAEAKRDADTLAAAMDLYADTVQIGPNPAQPILRKGPEIIRDLRKWFVNDLYTTETKRKKSKFIRKGLGAKRLDAITPDEILAIIDETKKRTAAKAKTQEESRRVRLGLPERESFEKTRPHSGRQAVNLFVDLSVFYNWATPKFRLQVNPISQINMRKEVGIKKSRDRVLSDKELRAYWWAAERMPVPYRQFFQFVALTGQRLSEIAEAPRWEFDLEKAIWIIPPARMKADRPHEVPLSPRAVELLRSLPAFQPGYRGGHLVFSVTDGRTAIENFDRAKKKLDLHMIELLREIAIEDGENPADIRFEPYKNHDVRRSVRTQLSGLEIPDRNDKGEVTNWETGRLFPDRVLESIIAHGRTGIQAVYDLNALRRPRMLALGMWAERLMEIVGAPPSRRTGNVVDLLVRKAS